MTSGRRLSRGRGIRAHAERSRARWTAIVAAVPDAPALDVRAIIAPHAGIMFSGPVAAYAYKAAAAASPYDVIALVGPSHFVAFEGVALYPGGAFESPLGLAQIDGAGVAALAESPIVRKHKGPHDREHSLEMQMPFLRRLLPDVPIVPMLMGFQRRQTILELAAGADDRVRESPRRCSSRAPISRTISMPRLRPPMTAVSASASPRSTPRVCWISSRSIRNTSAGATWRAAEARRSR